MDVRILIADDHPTVRESLRFVFSKAGMKHFAEATTCDEAIDRVRKRAIDVVLLDIALRDSNGIDALRRIKAIDASLPVLVHSYHAAPKLLSLSFHLDAAGYVIKGTDKNELIDAVRHAAAGGSTWNAEQLAQIRQADTELTGSRSQRRWAEQATGQSLAALSTTADSRSDQNE